MTEKYSYVYQFALAQPDATRARNRGGVREWQVVRMYSRQNSYGHIAEEIEYLAARFTDSEKETIERLAQKYDADSRDMMLAAQINQDQPAPVHIRPKKVIFNRFEQVFASQVFPAIEFWKIARCVGVWEDGVFHQSSKTMSKETFTGGEVTVISKLRLRYEQYTERLAKDESPGVVWE